MVGFDCVTPLELKGLKGIGKSWKLEGIERR